MTHSCRLDAGRRGSCRESWTRWSALWQSVVLRRLPKLPAGDKVLRLMFRLLLSPYCALPHRTVQSAFRSLCASALYPKLSLRNI